MNIKFRGKRKVDGEWVYGFYVYINKIHIIVYEDENGQHHENEVFPETVGQCLKLTKELEVYEGDITNEFGFVVTFVDGTIEGCSTMNIGWYEQRDDFESWNELEAGEIKNIIGNIHDNPELLKR